MDKARDARRADALSALLAGLQASLIGVLWMLALMGAASALRRFSFWTPENLMATFFYGGNALRGGFTTRTVSGLALYIVIYGVAGAAFAMALRDRLPRLRTLLLATIFGLCWYLLSYRLLWKSAMPLVALLHPERPTMLGHLVFGIALGRYPWHLPRIETPPEAENAPAVDTAVEPAVVEAQPERTDR